MSFTIGSLFDGSGGFPLAAFMVGGVPVWASEIEPYPIAVTTSRFPYMKHLGSVTDIKGDEIEPVDVISFGSPCQDLSVAGKRAGLKHEDNGDEETTRSGLFMEAVRIIKEMKEATNGKHPTFALFENVTGAFSSNKGEDFRVVLEELVKIVEPTAVMPEVPKAGWPYADTYCGDGWSLAYRVLDAQHWGVPQRRKRIYLVLDLRGERAKEVLFERESLRGYFEKGRTPWEGTAGDAADCSGTADCEGECVAYSLDPFHSNSMKSSNPHSGFHRTDIARTIDTTNPDPSKSQGEIAILEPVCYDARGNGEGNICPTLTGDHENRVTDYTALVTSCYWDGSQTCGTLTANNAGVGQRMPDKENFNCVIALDRAFYNQDVNAQYDPQLYEDGTNPTLVAKGPSAVCTGVDCRNATEYPESTGALQASCDHNNNNSNNVVRQNYIVRRLTPTECARLQGFPDKWGHPDHKDGFTDEEYQFWLNVRNTHAEINGKEVKDYTTEQMLKWYNKLHVDTSKYKMWGNGIALPNALYVMQGIADVFK